MSVALSPQLTASVGRTGVTPAHLLEVQDVNGNNYAWADRAITAPSAFTGSAVTFLPWLLRIPQITYYRSLQASSGQIVLQNVSGDTLARDMDKILRASALEGALFIYRMWQTESQDSWLTWQGTLSVDSVTEDEVTLLGKDLFDPNDIPTHDRQYSECCPLLWGSTRCGVTIVPAGDDGDVTPTRSAFVPAASLVALPAITSTPRPNYVPINPIGEPPGGGPGSPPGSPGNPGDPGTPGTVTSSVECNYSYQTCQVPERFGGVLNHYEPNYGEALARMQAPVRVRLRMV